MVDQKQLITIKGTRNGLTLIIEDTCSFEDALNELQEVVLKSQPKENERIVSVTVESGNRYLNDHQKIKLEEIVGYENRLEILAYESNVILKSEALKMNEESKVKIFNRIVRSGQILEVEGDLLLVGDVNPGGNVVSTGNIYILGSLRGTAHAGINGDKQVIIAASHMKPSQLRIADYISRAPDYETDGVYMECAFLDEEQDKIIIDAIHVLSKMRIELSGFERGMQNG